MSNSQLKALLEQKLAIVSGTSGATTTNALKNATAELNSLYKNQVVVPSLCEIALHSQVEEVRQLAAVECRKRIAQPKHTAWLKCTPHARTQIKQSLLHQLDSSVEPSRKVRHSLARVVAAIAEIEIPTGQFPDVLPWLWNSSSSDVVQKRENGVFTLTTVLDAFLDAENEAQFSAHTAQLYPLFAKTINDPESLEVRLSTIRALGNMSQYIGQEDANDIVQMQRMLPSILGVLEAAFKAESQEGVDTIIDVLETMGCSEAPLLHEHIPAICAFALHAGINEDSDADLRTSLLNIVHFLIRYKKTRIQQTGLSKQLLEGLMPIVALDDPEDTDEDSPSRAAVRVIDQMANALPPAHVVDPLISLCQQYTSSPDQRNRKAAIAAFGAIFEGCSIYLQPHMDDFWPLVEKSLADEDVRVRKAACIALSYMCDALGEDCAERHRQLLPLIVNLVQYPETQRNALNALDNLVEYLGKGKITPYLAQLMERLLALLPNVGRAEQAGVVGTIGSAAHAAKKQFRPYFEAAMQALIPFLSLTGEKDGEEAELLRGTVQDTVGTLAEAVGREAFEPYFRPCMELAIQGAGVESTSLRECSYIFFAVTARVYKADFGQWLPAIMPMLLASLVREEGGVDDANGALSAALNGNDEDGFGEDDEIESIDIEGQTALAQEKEVACDALKELFEHTGSAFVPYLPQTLPHIKELLDHFMSTLQKSAASTLLNYISIANEMTRPAKYTPGMSPAPLDGSVQQLANEIMPKIIELFEGETEQEVVQSLLEDFSSTFTAVGPALVLPYLQKLCHATLLILQRKHACQEQPADAESGELAEWDALLIRSAADLVSTLAAIFGPAFSSAFSQFLPILAGYYDPKSASSERAGVVGALAECCNGLEAGITDFTQQLIGLFAQALADSDLDVRSNAAYAAGCLVFHSTADLSQYYGSVLERINGLLSRDEEAKEDVKAASDNACGCIARLILKKADALPLEQVLPVYLAALPIKDDYRENGKVIESLCLLIRSQHPAVAPHLDVVLSIFARTLQKHRAATEAGEDAVLQPDTKDLIAQTVRSGVPEAQAQASGILALI